MGGGSVLEANSWPIVDHELWWREPSSGLQRWWGLGTDHGSHVSLELSPGVAADLGHVDTQPQCY